MLFSSLGASCRRVAAVARARPSAAAWQQNSRRNAGSASQANIDEIFVCNKAWREGVLEKDPLFFEKQAKLQTPRYLWIGCSDSRVSTDTICGLPPGSLFVHRNIANQILNIDTSVMSVIQFAVGVLKVQHIVVCGHYDCGGIKAAIINDDHPSPMSNWLRNIRDVYRLHRKELNSIKDLEVRGRRLVEINVIEQAINLYKTRVIQQRRVETYKDIEEFGFVQPKIHPCVYDPGTGELRRLDVEMQDYLSDLKDIYNLYKVIDEEDDMIEWEGMGPSVVLP
eukprot:TRINITY_DN65872_c0_g1_i1.p1 TRINITY_DN65872_c0_g1~~TRINITY_DN65872_c0_g1_i1.p1  ORF type:complete len:281 (+),score=55.42 TRINITY_DN65872_c0_g1_i1:128-970(+)